MSKLCPKCQYFVWPPLFPSTALTVLGMEFTRASQVATGILLHSSMTKSQSCWMLETLRSSTFCLRMPHRCSIGFRSGDMLGQSVTFTLSFFSKEKTQVLCNSSTDLMFSFQLLQIIQHLIVKCYRSDVVGRTWSGAFLNTFILSAKFNDSDTWKMLNIVPNNHSTPTYIGHSMPRHEFMSCHFLEKINVESSVKFMGPCKNPTAVLHILLCN